MIKRLRISFPEQSSEIVFIPVILVDVFIILYIAELINLRQVTALISAGAFLLSISSISPVLFVLFQEVIGARWSSRLYSSFPGFSKIFHLLKVVWLLIFILFSYTETPAEYQTIAGEIWFNSLFIFVRTSFFLFLWEWIYHQLSMAISDERKFQTLHVKSPKYLTFMIFSLFLFSWDWLVIPLQNSSAGICVLLTICATFGISLSILIIFKAINHKLADFSSIQNDLARYLLTFCCLWMYLFFSLALITGYEGSYQKHFNTEQNFIISILTLLTSLCCFVIPFSLLLTFRQRTGKLNSTIASFSFLTGNYFWILLFYIRFF